MTITPSPRLSLAAAFVGFLGLLGTAISMEVLRTQRRDVEPESESLGAAAGILARDVHKGDAIAFFPTWSASERWRFAEAYAKGGVDFDASLINGSPQDVWDADGYKRLWVLTTHDRAKRLELPIRRIRNEDLDHGTELLLYELGASRTVYDLRKHVGEAVVERQRQDGSFTQCTWNGKKHTCDNDWWHDVWDELHEVGNDRHPGLFLQPTDKKLISRITWPKVPGARVLAGRVGNRLWAVRNDVGADVRIRALAGEREVWSIVLTRGDFEWHPFEVPLRPGDAGQPIRVEWLTDDPAWRQTAIDLRLLDAAEAAPRAPALAVPSSATATTAPTPGAAGLSPGMQVAPVAVRPPGVSPHAPADTNPSKRGKHVKRH